MEEEEDAILLNSLGVTSANPEDIERNILEKVTIILFNELFSFLNIFIIVIYSAFCIMF